MKNVFVHKLLSPFSGGLCDLTKLFDWVNFMHEGACLGRGGRCMVIEIMGWVGAPWVSVVGGEETSLLCKKVRPKL